MQWCQTVVSAKPGFRVILRTPFARLTCANRTHNARDQPSARLLLAFATNFAMRPCSPGANHVGMSWMARWGSSRTLGDPDQ